MAKASRVLETGVPMTRNDLASVDGAKIGNRFYTRAHRSGHTQLAAQALLGPSSVATTQRYTAVDDQSLWDAIGGVA